MCSGARDIACRQTPNGVCVPSRILHGPFLRPRCGVTRQIRVVLQQRGRSKLARWITQTQRVRPLRHAGKRLRVVLNVYSRKLSAETETSPNHRRVDRSVPWSNAVGVIARVCGRFARPIANQVCLTRVPSRSVSELPGRLVQTGGDNDAMPITKREGARSALKRDPVVLPGPIEYGDTLVQRQKNEPE